MKFPYTVLNTGETFYLPDMPNELESQESIELRKRLYTDCMKSMPNSGCTAVSRVDFKKIFNSRVGRGDVGRTFQERLNARKGIIIK